MRGEFTKNRDTLTNPALHYIPCGLLAEYVLRPDLMRKAPPPMDELEKQAKLISEDKKWGDKYEVKNIPVALIQNSMRLMYKGHEELGWKFANMAWSSKFPVDEVFFSDW